METVKEKLNKLIHTAADYSVEMCERYVDCNSCPHFGDSCYAMTDYLIQNGVTIQKWVSVDEPPKENGKYLVLLEQGGMIDAKYEKRRGGFGDYHEDWTEDGLVHTWVPFKIVAHWMPLPAPPEGVQ